MGGRKLAAVAVALLALATADARASSGWRTISSPLAGFELSYPSGWHAVRRGDGGIGISTFPLQRADDFPPRPAGSAWLIVFDYGRMGRPLPHRPPHLRLPPPTDFEGLRHASTTSFEQAGHNFQVFAVFGPGASARTRALVLRVLGTLRTTEPPLANDNEIVVLGRDARGKPVRAFHYGDFRSRNTVLVVGCTGAPGCGADTVTLQLVNAPTTRANIWVIQAERGTDAARRLAAQIHPTLTIRLPQHPFSLAAARARARAILQRIARR